MYKVLIILVIFFSTNAFALDRVALVIGNANYKINSLERSVNDAQDIALKLKELNFRVMLVEDADKAEMVKAISEFGEQMKESDTSLFFFAGHAVQMGSKNYLMPINSLKSIGENLGDLNNYDQIQRFKNEAISSDILISLIENGNAKQNFIFLDACRDNPLPENTLEGLSKMTIGDKGTLISYSTSPGKLASDGSWGRNSPYTKHLLKLIKNPNQTIESLLKEVGSAVSIETEGAQLPWVATNLVSNFCFNDVNGGCARVVIPILDEPFLEGLYNIKIKNLDNGDHYVGQMNKGLFNGKGVLTYSNGSKYEGNFFDNQRHGNGTITQLNGNSFEGIFIDGKRDGKGILRWVNGAIMETIWIAGERIYTDAYFAGAYSLNGFPNGYGTLYRQSGESIQSNWIEGVPDGEVIFTSRTGNLYKGEFNKGNFNGNGVLTTSLNEQFKGNFVNGKLHGQGTRIWPNGDRYKGQFDNGLMNGLGEKVFNSEKLYVGNFVNDKFNGQGELTYDNGDNYTGNFLNDNYH